MLLDRTIRGTFIEVLSVHPCKRPSGFVNKRSFLPLCSLDTFVEISPIKTFCKNLYITVIKIFIIPENVVLNPVQKQYIQNKSLSFKVTSFDYLFKI